MPIRRRNNMWQADVITSDGRRERKSFTSKSAAQTFISERKPNVKQNPQSRSGKASPVSSHRMQSTGLKVRSGRSVGRSSAGSEESKTGKSLPRTSVRSATVGAKPNPARGLHITQHCDSGSDSSGQHGQLQTESLTSQVEKIRRGLSLHVSLVQC